MKTLSIVTFLAVLTAASVALFSCNDSKSGKGKLDPSAKVYISAAPGVRSVADSDKPGHLSAREIVRQAQGMCFNETHSMGVEDWNRDTVNNRFMYHGTMIIAQNGTLDTGFIDAVDMVLVTLTHDLLPLDTIAYLPNQVLRDAGKVIRAAYEREDYAACYSLFEKAYTFIPITGEEWRALKAQNKQ